MQNLPFAIIYGLDRQLLIGYHEAIHEDMSASGGDKEKGDI